MKELPQSVKACLWSYDVERFDLSLPDNRARLIINVLNRGTADAISWLRKNFSEDEIVEVIKTSSVSSWGKKSLSLWSQVFNVLPEKTSRFI